jgi:hypothetical protein
MWDAGRRNRLRIRRSADLAVYGEPRSDRLELNIETCSAVLSANVEETTNEIRILVTRPDDPGRDDDDCADHIFVALDEP